jgi:hypothetical protein
MRGFLRLRGDTYYFRCRVPLDLHGTYFQGREILKSLHTRDKKRAKDAAADWYCRVTRVFYLCRVKSLPESRLQELIQAEIDVPERAYVEAMLGVYELNRIELLRDVFVAYERSCQQYLAIRQELVPPDTFRLRYRQALSAAVKAIVLQRQEPTRDAVVAIIPPEVAEEDRDKFVKLVLDEFANLHEGNATFRHSLNGVCSVEGNGTIQNVSR